MGRIAIKFLEAHKERIFVDLRIPYIMTGIYGAGGATTFESEVGGFNSCGLAENSMGFEKGNGKEWYLPYIVNSAYIYPKRFAILLIEQVFFVLVLEEFQSTNTKTARRGVEYICGIY